MFLVQRDETSAFIIVSLSKTDDEGYSLIFTAGYYGSNHDCSSRECQVSSMANVGCKRIKKLIGMMLLGFDSIVGNVFTHLFPKSTESGIVFIFKKCYDD